ncbi:protein ANTI-SILENCING 1-like [Bidens hawaiensis]|uniref:protein ANTI-SILENCING 1-like n=1 Tax=Bidens hawaiensis TaxID=980011 RepID=UPI004049D8C2
MSTLEEENANLPGDIEFIWGHKTRLGKQNPNFQHYESFTLDGIDYFLYDSVYMWCGNQKPPYVAKIIDMYETPRLKKMVKIVWYFRPIEAQKWLQGACYLNNELFLALGEGNGVCNFNPVEAICGKCNAVCTSKDKRNPKASMEELKMSDYVFYRVFDVEKCRLSERFPDKIARTAVEHFFNQKTKSPEVTGKSNSSCETGNTSSNVLRFTASSDTHHSKKRKPLEFEVDEKKSVEADSGLTKFG